MNGILGDEMGLGKTLQVCVRVSCLFTYVILISASHCGSLYIWWLYLCLWRLSATAAATMAAIWRSTLSRRLG